MSTTTRNRDKPIVQVTPVREGTALSLPAADSFGYARKAAPADGIYIETADGQALFLSSMFLRAALEHLSTLPDLVRRIPALLPGPRAAKEIENPRHSPTPEELWLSADRNFERYIKLLIEHKHMKETVP